MGVHGGQRSGGPRGARARWSRAAALSALLAGCNFVSQNPHDQKRAWQETQARRLAPARLQEGDGRWGRARVARVRVYADASYRKQHTDWLAHFEDQLRRANEVLRPAFELRLEVYESPEWEPTASPSDLDALLTELEQKDPGDDVQWVIGLVGPEPRALTSFNELGRARVLGKHLVLRDMDDEAEQKAFAQGLDTFDADERRRLYVARREHKETTCLLHELGHTLGAIHTREPNWIMHAAYHQDMVGFAPDNRDLMWRLLSLRLSGAKPEALVAEEQKRLAEAEWTGWDPEARAEMLALLGQATAPAAPEPEPMPVVGPVQIEDPADDMMALPLEERARFRDTRKAVTQGQGAKLWDDVERFARDYPDVYATQHLACELGLQLGRMQSAQGYCERMTELAKKLQ
jgi:hypothetical protein